MRFVLGCLLLSGSILSLAGCLPGLTRSEIDGPISVSAASIRISESRSDNGVSYTLDYQLGEHKVQAAWQLGNAMKRTSKLQLKMPIEATFDEVVQGMQLALADRQNNPWFLAINDTIIELMMEVHEEETKRAEKIAPDSPYRAAVKVQKQIRQWFVEVDVRIVDENGNNVGM
ncbi:MAG: hypothetical protein HKN47_05785 [Pirellulaceae bacterium]|nr:hypothetical protein [Pirellulaceae bacterium]